MRGIVRRLLESWRRLLHGRNRRVLFLFIITSGLLLGAVLGVISNLYQEEATEEVQKQEETPINEGRILRILLKDMDLTNLSLESPKEDLTLETSYPVRAHTAPIKELGVSRSYLEQMHPPYQGDVVLEYGWYRHSLFQDWRFHPGLQYQGARGPVLASMGGRVVEVNGEGSTYSLLLDHGNGLTTEYGLLEKVLVEYGQVVERGESIAYPSTNGEENLLSFRVMEEEEHLDPLEYLIQGK